MGWVSVAEWTELFSFSQKWIYADSIMHVLVWTCWYALIRRWFQISDTEPIPVFVDSCESSRIHLLSLAALSLLKLLIYSHSYLHYDCRHLSCVSLHWQFWYFVSVWIYLYFCFLFKTFFFIIILFFFDCTFPHDLHPLCSVHFYTGRSLRLIDLI